MTWIKRVKKCIEELWNALQSEYNVIRFFYHYFVMVSKVKDEATCKKGQKILTP